MRSRFLSVEKARGLYDEAIDKYETLLSVAAADGCLEGHRYST
jgi:hypothetical protein